MNNDLLKQLPDSPQWALLAGGLGKFLIFGGIALFLSSIVLWILQGKTARLGKPATLCFFAGCFSILGAMACLVSLFVTNQFEFQYVFSHGDILTSLNYKIAGVWTAQQGSFLLWACTSSIFGLLAFRSAGEYRRWYAVSFSVFLGCLCGILAYETPFELMKDLAVNGVVKMPHSGAGMTPALQNYWVIIHPPTIFMGFGSLTVMFALSVAAMLTGNIVDWVKVVRPWALISVSILGLGLCMGGMWAYETQGWGGFWAWDPVENVSFVPWLFTVALVHGVIVQVTKRRWIGTNLILGGLPFLTFVYGTFLTRSGLLDKVSVHSFAEMDHSALVVLVVFLALISIAFIALYIVRGRKLAKQSAIEEPTPGIDREGAYRAGVLLLSLMATGIAMGMSWPWWSAIRSGTGSAVEEKQYHLVIVWFFIPILLLMGASPFVSWRKLGGKEIFNRLVSVLSVAAGLTGFALVAIQNPTIGVHMVPGETVTMPFGDRMMLMPWMAVLIFVCVFTAVANIWRVVEIFKRSKLGIGGFVAHIGIAVLMSGLIISRGFEQRDGGIVDPGRGPTKILGYSISFNRLQSKSVDDRDGKVIFNVDGPDGQHFEATPGLYYYPGDDGTPTAMVWPYVQKHLSHDFYMAMNKPEMYAWETPLEFKVGETRTIKGSDDPADLGMTVTYKKFVMEGQPGMVGTKFGAQLHIVDEGREYDVTPTLTITGEEGLAHSLPPVGQDYRMDLDGMDVATKSVQLRLMFSPPLYPIILFYKPMTILVWLGAGIMTLGGLLSAFARRNKPTRPGSGLPSGKIPAVGANLDELLESSGAVLRGHFLLTSGRHSDVYFEKFRILEQPHVLSALCKEIADHYRDLGVELVAGPTTGGIIIAFEVARQLGLPSAYIETENGVKTFRRSKTIPAGIRTLIVDDVLTTGTSLFESRAAVESFGCKPIGYGVLIDRSAPATEFGLPLFSAYQVQAQSFAPEEIPDWLAAIPATKPGTRIQPAGA